MPETALLSRKRRLLAWVLGALIVALLLFIWGNSLDDRAASARKSAAFVAMVRPLVLALPVTDWHDEPTIHLITRKLAHFAQFFALGALVTGFAWAVRPVRRIATGALALFCLAVATTDELLQFISQRAPAMQDVLLDMAGAACGLGCVLLAQHFVRRRRRAHA